MIMNRPSDGKVIMGEGARGRQVGDSNPRHKCADLQRCVCGGRGHFRLVDYVEMEACIGPLCLHDTQPRFNSRSTRSGSIRFYSSSLRFAAP